MSEHHCISVFSEWKVQKTLNGRFACEIENVLDRSAGRHGTILKRKIHFRRILVSNAVRRFLDEGIK
jgi:hypothetical protein